MPDQVGHNGGILLPLKSDEAGAGGEVNIISEIAAIVTEFRKVTTD